MHDVFISYSRKNIDFARHLEKRLREYKPPRDVNVAQRYLNVFRDEADFTGADYVQSVERHLADSVKLVVVCSPAARGSKYVNDEIRHFAQTRGAENIVALLLDGLPNNEASAERGAELAFPDALCEALTMPLAIPYSGFDAKKDRVDRGSFAGSWFSLLANVYGVTRAEVERREKRRQSRIRRITVSIVSAVITTLAVALVVSLMFWGQAVEQRGIAENARDQEAAQRKIADERREEADRERASAVREAVAARSQMAGRVAVQALEKLNGAPETALNLGITAVNAFHSHGDPLVLPAVGALQKINLSFAASRPVFPRNGSDAFVVDPTLKWAAASGPRGKVWFGQTGSADPQLAPLPRGSLGRDERWADEPPRLLFTEHRLIAAVAIATTGKRDPVRGVLLSWPLSAHGVADKASVISSFTLDDLRTVRLLASPDDRWLFWTDGWRRGFLQRMDATGTALPLDCSGSNACKVIAFSPDSRMFFLRSGSSIHRYILTDDKPLEQPAVETRTTEAIDVATTMHRDTSRRSEKETVRLAIFDLGGTVEWWDMSDPAPERHTLSNVFSAFKNDLEVYGVESDEVRGTLEWRGGGEGILVTAAERKGEFGVAAFHDLTSKAGWQPIEHRYETKALETMASTRGTIGGPLEGYRVKNAANLGVSSAMWITPLAVLTVGFDGTVRFRELEDRVAEEFTLLATDVASALLVGKWIALGKRDGRISFVDIDRDRPDPVLVLNGHGAPVREVRAALDPSVGIRRMLSSDSGGVTRIWDMASPIAQIPIDDNMHISDVVVTSDWRWLVRDSGKEFWPMGLPDPLWAPQRPAAFATAKAVAWNADASQAATLQVEPEHVVVRLWTLGGSRPTRALRAERRFAMANLGSYNTWSLRLSTDEHAARIIIERNGLKNKSLWIADLLRPGEPLRTLGDSEFKLHGASPDLQWLVVSRSATNTAEKQLAYLADWTRAPKFIRLSGLEIDYVNGWSGDGRWVAMRGHRTSDIDPQNRFPVKHEYIVDLRATATSGRADQLAEGSEGRIYFGYGRPPMVRDAKGALQVWQASPGPRPRFVNVAHSPSNIAWDRSGQWMAMTRDDRVWLARPGGADSPAEIASHIAAVMRGQPLPSPAEAQATGNVSDVFAFPELGWIVAETENKHILVWHRGADAVWQPPLVFTRNELRIDRLSNVRFRPDGRMALFGDQVMSFDPAHLMAYSRRLMAGRLEK